MATNKIQTGLRLEEGIYEKAKVISAKERRSLNNLFEYAIQKYIEDYENKHGTVQPLDDE